MPHSAVGPVIPMTPMHRGTLFEMIPLPAYVKDADLTFTHVNPALCDLLGCERNDIIGRRAPIMRFGGMQICEETERTLLASGGTTTVATVVERHGLPPLRGELVLVRIDDADGLPVGMLGALIDRTRLFDTVDRLQATETLHRVILESISDAVLMLDEAGCITFVAPHVATIFGVSPEEAMALGSLDLLLGHGEPRLVNVTREVETSNIECRAVRPDGTTRDLLVNVKPIRFGRARWLVTCHDVSDRVAALSRHKAAMVNTIQALCATVERRDPYVVGHQDRVADLATAIGRRVGLDEDRLEGLRLAAVVHDIGKISVPIEILNKPGKLSRAEFDIIKTHPDVGYEILRDIEFPWPIARMVREHHEAFDGSGYPLGIAGDQILPESRILSVADVLEAVTSHRPYRPGLGLAKGLEALRAMRGTKLDPDVVDACLDLIESGEVAVPGWTFDEAC